MDLELSERALDDLEELSRDLTEEIMARIEELEEKQLSHPKVKMIKDDSGDWIWRLKVKDEEADHRVFLDIVEEKLRVLKIMHRDIAYED